MMRSCFPILLMMSPAASPAIAADAGSPAAQLKFRPMQATQILAVADFDGPPSKLVEDSDPEWPWIPFGSFIDGTSYVNSGTAEAIERDAQFQNGFGAMVHSRVTCLYDLAAAKVISVAISPR
jgi:hypothetical protein